MEAFPFDSALTVGIWGLGDEGTRSGLLWEIKPARALSEETAV